MSGKPPPAALPARRGLVTLFGIGAILALGAWLRWLYLRDVSLYVDEFTTLWAAKQVQVHGLPIMPSGVLYTRGLLATYVEAAALWLGGFSFSVGRFPSLLFGLLSMITVFAAGRRGWRTSAGLLAALGLALLPEAIQWGGRARFYSQFQFLTMLLLWVAWEAIQPRDPDGAARSAWARWMAVAACFVLALFTQEQTLLLYPGLLLAVMIWRGWRTLTSAPVLAANGLMLAAVALRYAVEVWGQPGYFETIQATRPYVGAIFDFAGALQRYGPLLIAPDRLAWTLAAGLALIAALAAAVRARSVRTLAPFHQATLYYSHFLGGVLFAIFALVGTSWRDPRYLYFVQPIWLQLGAAGLVWLLETLAGVKNQRLFAPLVTVAGVLLAATLAPAAWRMTQSSVESWDKALAEVAQQRAPADVVLSPQPPACALMLDECDFYALQRGYEEYVVRRDGVLMDRWTGSAVLTTTTQLLTTVANAPATWFVSDANRLATRYDGDFLRALLEQFDPVVEAGGVIGLRAQGWREPPTFTAARSYTPTIRFGPLQLHEVRQSEARAGAALEVELLWSAAEQVGTQINTSIRVVDGAGTVIAQQDGPPARGVIPTTLFFDTPLPDRKSLLLPANLAGGRYRIDVAAYAVEGTVPQGEVQPVAWFWLGKPLNTEGAGALATWQNGLQIVGGAPFPLPTQPGEEFTYTLVWQASRPLTQTLTAFVQLLDADGTVLAQHDRQPDDGFFPTWAWQPGEPVRMDFALMLPSPLPLGARFVAGWYDAVTGERIRLTSTEDSYPLLGPLQ